MHEHKGRGPRVPEESNGFENSLLLKIKVFETRKMNWNDFFILWMLLVNPITGVLDQ